MGERGGRACDHESDRWIRHRPLSLVLVWKQGAACLSIQSASQAVVGDPPAAERTARTCIRFFFPSAAARRGLRSYGSG